MLAVYLDESGDGTTALIGGLIAPIERWTDLTRRWNEILSRDGRFDYWHQRDAWEHERAPWDSLTKESYRTLIAEFVEALQEAAPWGVSVSLRIEDWNAEVPKQVPIKKGLDTNKKLTLAREFYGSPYSILAASLIDAVLKRVDDEKNVEDIELIMEASSKARDGGSLGALHWMIDAFAEKGGSRFRSATIVNGKDKQHRPLEAADIFDWALRRKLSSGHDELWDQLRIESQNTPISRQMIRGWYAGLPKESE